MIPPTAGLSLAMLNDPLSAAPAPEAARQALATLQADPARQRRLLAGDDPDHGRLKRRLTAAAYPAAPAPDPGPAAPADGPGGYAPPLPVDLLQQPGGMELA